MTEALEARVARLEAIMESLGRQMGRELEVGEAIHRSMNESVTKLTTIVEKQDSRLDSIERNIAWAIGAVAVIIVIVNLIAPAIRISLGLPD